MLWENFFIYFFHIFVGGLFEEFPQMLLVIPEEAIEPLVISEDDVDGVKNFVVRVIVGLSWGEVLHLLVSWHMLHILLLKTSTSPKLSIIIFR